MGRRFLRGVIFHLQGRGEIFSTDMEGKEEPGMIFTPWENFFLNMFSENVSKNTFFFILGAFKTFHFSKRLKLGRGHVKILTVDKGAR